MAGGESTAIEDIARLGDVPLPVRAELYQMPVKVRDILELRAGTVITTKRRVGESIDVYAAGERIGCGEIVAAGDRIAIRITAFATARPRMEACRVQ